MVVKIVTDSTCDLPAHIAKDLDITVVPAYVHFGNKTYRDGVDITCDELYRRLVEGPVHPTTSAPSPGDFVQAYNKLAEETDNIVSITVTSKMSAIYKSAMIAREALVGKCRIEVVDSQSMTMGLGLITMAGAERARHGDGMEEVLEAIRNAIPRVHLVAMLDTLKYALKGGRLGKASRLLGAMIKVKPMISMRDGEVIPAGLARTRVKAIDRLTDFVRKRVPIEEIAVVHNTSPKEAETLAGRLKSIIPDRESIMAKVGPGLGVHGGPGALVVVLRESVRHLDRPAGEERKGIKLSLPSLHIPR
jgi:DegV family protein with EDD domain